LGRDSTPRPVSVGSLARISRLAESRRDRIVEARGRGLLLGIELRPDAGGARAYCERLMGQGVLCKETHEHTIRIAPPLVITEADLDWGLDRIEGVLSD
jgi:ornithine--oxo-acid transaminase